MPPRKKPVRRKKAAPASVGLTAAETRAVTGAEVDRLAAQVDDDGGAVLGRYNDPHGARARAAEVLERRRRERVRLRVRAARVYDARHLLRGAPAAERRRLSIDPAARRRIPRRADRQGAERARAVRTEDSEAGR